ncbi:unnamed protein product [marine sediment metagenome]|uniref:Uncharacterized protein n=1 Tax=marine sediment metagenome TaxID=412755 RepID=X1EUB6_9ZZZZ
MYRQSQLLIDEEARQLARDIGLPFPKDDKIWESAEEEPEEEPDNPEKPDKTEDFIKQRDRQRKYNLIERLKDAEFLADQELFQIDRR